MEPLVCGLKQAGSCDHDFASALILYNETYRASEKHVSH